MWIKPVFPPAFGWRDFFLMKFEHMIFKLAWRGYLLISIELIKDRVVSATIFGESEGMHVQLLHFLL